MSRSFSVVGALRASFSEQRSFDGEVRPAGIGVHLAVCLARLGAPVTFVAGVAPGECRPSARAPLVAQGVDLVPFGLQAPPGEAQGDEGWVTFDEALARAVECDACLVQLELPEVRVEAALAAAREAKRTTILHALPAREVAGDQLSGLDLLIASVSGAKILARCGEEHVARRGLARRLAALGPQRVALSSGEGRMLAFDGEVFSEIREPVSRAGVDLVSQFVFAAAISVALADGWHTDKALRFAARAAALQGCGEGDFPELPSARDLESLLASAET